MEGKGEQAECRIHVFADDTQLFHRTKAPLCMGLKLSTCFAENQEQRTQEQNLSFFFCQQNKNNRFSCDKMGKQGRMFGAQFL